VMPMPDLGSPASAGELTGLCISQQATDTGTAADFVVYASSTPALGYVASQGYLQPANQTVALSPAFQQPGHLPQHASVFTLSVKTMQFPPLMDQWDALDAATNPRLERMLGGRPRAVPALTRRIDRTSRTLLQPEDQPSSSPSSGSSGSTQSSG
jgi:multiple sugar transport system substrate-binding protein